MQQAILDVALLCVSVLKSVPLLYVSIVKNIAFILWALEKGCTDTEDPTKVITGSSATPKTNITNSILHYHSIDPSYCSVIWISQLVLVKRINVSTCESAGVEKPVIKKVKFMSFRIKIQFLTYRYAIINMLYFISMMLCIFTFSIFQTSSSLNGFWTQLITLQSVEVALTPVMIKVPYIYHRGDSP